MGLKTVIHFTIWEILSRDGEKTDFDMSMCGQMLRNQWETRNTEQKCLIISLVYSSSPSSLLENRNKANKKISRTQFQRCWKSIDLILKILIKDCASWNFCGIE